MEDGKREVRYVLDAGAPVGTPADSWLEFAEMLAEWVSKPVELEVFEEEARAFAARAVLLAGGEAVPA